MLLLHLAVIPVLSSPSELPIASPFLSRNLVSLRATLVAQMVKNLPTMQETWVLFPCWEDPLEKEMSTHSCILAWETSWTEEPDWLQFMGVTKSWTRLSVSLLCIGEGDGNPLQCSCLENPRDRGAYWAAIYGVTQSRTRLTRLSSKSD